MEGNERRRQLAKVLHATLSAAPVTAERLAKMFSVSVRTVRYDLDALAEAMRSEGLCIRTQARRGIWLERVEPVQEGVSTAAVLDRKERRDRIILALLGSEPCSIDGIAEELAISRNTLISDLKDVQATLEQRGLIYVSKRGAGISATGGEQEIRDVLRSDLIQCNDGGQSVRRLDIWAFALWLSFCSHFFSSVIYGGRAMGGILY